MKRKPTLLKRTPPGNGDKTLFGAMSFFGIGALLAGFMSWEAGRGYGEREAARLPKEAEHER